MIYLVYNNNVAVLTTICNNNKSLILYFQHSYDFSDL